MSFSHHPYGTNVWKADETVSLACMHKMQLLSSVSESMDSLVEVSSDTLLASTTEV